MPGLALDDVPRLALEPAAFVVTINLAADPTILVCPVLAQEATHHRPTEILDHRNTSRCFAVKKTFQRPRMPV